MPSSQTSNSSGHDGGIGKNEQRLQVLFHECCSSSALRHKAGAAGTQQQQHIQRPGVAGFVSESLCPVVLVCASEKAKHAARRRKLLSVSELLKPFERMEDINGEGRVMAV